MLLQLKDVHKKIGIDEILTNISFILEDREKAALVGVNGAGKTSVFRLLTGEWQPDGGAITLSAGARIGYLPQLVSDIPGSMNEQYHGRMKSAQGTAGLEIENEGRSLYGELDSVFLPLKKMEEEIRSLEKEMGTASREALTGILERYTFLTARYEEQGGYESGSRVRGVLKGLGFPDTDWQKPCHLLSGGQQTRAALGKLLLSSPDLLLLDEPTNHLDIDSVAWLEEYLRAFVGGIIIVSHDRYFMDRVTTKTIEIENKKSKVYNGNYSFFAAQKVIDREVARKHFTEQQKIIKHHEEVIKTLRSYKTEAAIIRAKSREKLLAKIERVDKPENLPASMRLRLNPRIQSGHDVLTAEGLSMGFNGKTIFENISLEIKKGDKTALVGPNGIGKTTLLKILVKDLNPLSGKIREGVNLRIGYYDQARQRLSEEKTVFQELADTYPRLTQTEIRNILAAFVFIGDDVFKPISALSGGERGRVALARIMLGGANFLVLDEPTNHLDLFSKEILEEAMREFPGTLLYISHDRYFINHTATKVLELSAKGLTEYIGNYDYYIEKKKLLAEEARFMPETSLTLHTAASPEESAIRSGKDEWLLKKEIETTIRRKKTRLSRLEAEIAETETRIKECDDKLHEEAIATNALAAAELYEEKTELENKLLELYGDWELNAVNE